MTVQNFTVKKYSHGML